MGGCHSCHSSTFPIQARSKDLVGTLEIACVPTSPSPLDAKSRPDILANIVNGRATQSPQSNCHGSKLVVDTSLLIRSGAHFVQGMQLHGWIHLQELCIVGGLVKKNGSVVRPAPSIFGGLYHGEIRRWLLPALANQHVHLKKLALQIRLKARTLPVGSLDLVAELLDQQTQLEELDLSGSFLAKGDRVQNPNIVSNRFVDAMERHEHLQTLVLAYTNAGIETTAALLGALSHSIDTTPKSTLRHLDLSHTFSSMNFEFYYSHPSHKRIAHLLQHLPFLKSLETLRLDYIVLYKKNEVDNDDDNDGNDSLVFQIHQVCFLDRVYQRLHLIEHEQPQSLPTSLLPLLGFVPEGHHGHRSAPYVSDTLRTHNQLLLGGFPVAANTNSEDNTNCEEKHMMTVRSHLMPDWKESWNQHTHCHCHCRRSRTLRHSRNERCDCLPLLETLWQKCRFESCASALQPTSQQQLQLSGRQTQGTFRETALFSLLRENSW